MHDLPALTNLQGTGTGVAGKVINATSASRRILEGYYFGAFSRMKLDESRWSDGSFPVWYGADTEITAAHEVLHHAVARRLLEGGKSALVNWKERRSLITASCEGVLINLINFVGKHSWLIDNAYLKCQQLGKHIHDKDLHGILYQSARSTGKCAAIFKREKLSGPKVLGDIFLSCSGKDFEVRHADGRAILSASMPPSCRI